MLSEATFNRKMGELGTVMKRQGSTDTDESLRLEVYHRELSKVAEDADFIEACDRLMWTDEWFPTLARLRQMTNQCKTERLRHERKRREDAAARNRKLVCGTCAGARMIRLGGASPLKVLAGEEGSRVAACPDCTNDGEYDPHRERWGIEQYGGVPDPARQEHVDMRAQTWPEELRQMRRADGSMDMAELYRLSRELRGLDADVDERFNVRVEGWSTVADIGFAADD